MNRPIESSIVAFNGRIAALVEWVRNNGSGNDVAWLTSALSDSSDCLGRLLIKAGRLERAGIGLADSAASERNVPELGIARTIVGQMQDLSVCIERELVHGVDDTGVTSLAGRLIGNIYLDVIRPLQCRYPELAAAKLDDANR